MTDLTPGQLAVLRAVPEQPGARFPSTDAEVLTLDWLVAWGMARAVPYYRRGPGGLRHYDVCYQRTPAGARAVEESER